jgi:hypothetical protein
MNALRPFSKFTTLTALSLATLCTTLSVGCAVETDEGDTAAGDSDDLTSLSARSRDLQFQGVVFLPEGASDASITAAIQEQARTAFGPLREAQVMVNTRELKKPILPANIAKAVVRVVDPKVAGDAGKAMLQVRYTYVDDAVVAKSLARRSTVQLALVSRQSFELRTKTLAECTNNDDDARSFPLWYEFKPQLASCKTAIKTEQAAIDADRAKLAAGSVPKSEVERVYLPITVKLGADKTNKGESYPEYDKLFSGGVIPGKLVIGMAYGMIDHEAPAGGVQEDSGYGEWMANLGEVFAARPGFKLVRSTPEVDLSSVKLSTGKTITGLGFEKFIEWNQRGTGFPAGITSAERKELEKTIGERVYRHFFTFEAPMKVTVGAGATKDVGLQIFTYFGVEGDQQPHKVLIKNSDVYLYNGHSMIGSGPLDPRNFTASDFPKSYQILFVDGCVSYNYYEKDYFPMKGGSQNLDLITNALEAPSFNSGLALGKFVSALTSGTQPSYMSLLKSAAISDSGPSWTLRVVDGELDNKYSPKTTPITVR